MSVSTEPITLNTESADQVEVRVITDVTIYTPCHLRLSWFLYEIALTNSMVLSLLYWILVYDGNFSNTKFNNNFLTTILLIIDCFITKYPIRLLHCIYPILFFFIYFIFNVIYCHIATVFPNMGYHYIYRVLDWSHPLFPATGVVVVIVMIYPISHLFWFGLYQFRLYLWRRYGQTGTI